MKYVRQFGIILAISLMGEWLNLVLPLPIPGSVYGLVLLLLALLTGVVKLHQVQESASFLVEIMPVMFVPAGVGLLESWGVLQPVWVPVAVITVITTVLVMVVSGWVAQFAIRRGKRREK